MTTTAVTVPADGTWIEVTSGAAPAAAFRIANVGRMSVLLRFVSAAPGANASGERLEAGQAIDTAVLSRVFARKDPNGAADTSEVLVFTAG